MPVRLLTSSVLRWPSAETVHAAAHPSVVAIGHFGSYARGDAGVGSDLDLVVLVRESVLAFERRAARFNLELLPVPAEALVYTLDEWDQLRHDRSRFSQVLRSETRWLVGTPRDG